jgi:hypothetical protein
MLHQTPAIGHLVDGLASDYLASSIEPPGGHEMKSRDPRASLVSPRRAASQCRRRWFRTGAMTVITVISGRT